MNHCDVAIIGGGVVGLATAWQLSQKQPRLRLIVLEAEPHLAMHQTSHNSGVVHAGVYYLPGSLKAQLCTRGKQMLEEFCTRREIPLRHDGKLVVATQEEELGRLADLYQRATLNGVPGLRRVEQDELKSLEPSVTGLAGIHSPRTGVVDFEQVAKALGDDIVQSGGQVRTSWKVDAIGQTGDRVEITSTSGETITATSVVVCAGLQADRLAGPIAADLRVVPFRGRWFNLTEKAAAQVNGSIYPVPDPRLPFLGVHVTRRIDGQVWAGPNAFLALSRSKYTASGLTLKDARSALAFPGLWRFGARNMSTAWTEFSHDVSRRAYAKAVAEYLPAIRPADLSRGAMGIRAQAMSRQGQLIDDFEVRRDRRVLHVLNAPSPAATSALAIGEYLADAVESSRA